MMKLPLFLLASADDECPRLEPDLDVEWWRLSGEIVAKFCRIAYKHVKAA